MRKRAIVAALSVLGVALIWSAGAQAALTELTVRIEGKQRTLFEGPIETDGHQIQSFSDDEQRTCDATNNGAHPNPGPTPTAASADAMELIGQDFDGDWYPGFDDYFIERWGPDDQDDETYAYWGILVNGVFTPVGGCQYLAEEGDEVFWAYDAFNGRQMLWLAAADDAGFPAAPVANVEVNEPLELTVQAGDQPSPSAVSGVTVAPVATAAVTGFQTVATGNSGAVTTDGDGHASITFTTPGWQRIKAQKEVGFIRSNRLDVCVEPVGGGGCGPLPDDAAVRVAPRYAEEPPTEAGGGKKDPPPPGGNTPPLATGEDTAPPGPVAMRKATLNRDNGTATLAVALPVAGRLAVSGPKVVNRKLNATGAKVVRVLIKPNAAGLTELEEQGKLRVSLRVEFTPVGAQTSTKTRGLTLRLGPARG